MLEYVYITFLLLIIFFACIGIYFMKKLPVKIKAITGITLALVFLRYIYLLVMLFKENIKYLYLFRNLYFLNYIFIPICGILSLYILIRSDKIKMIHIIILLVIIISAYVFQILRLPIDIKLFENPNLGYFMIIEKNEASLQLPYFAMNILFLVITMRIFYKTNADNLGCTLALASELVTIIVIILSYLTYDIFPQYVVNELMWIITFVYCLRKTLS